MNKQLNKLKNSLTDRKAIIIANGPSTSKIDFSVLKQSDICSFATNRISLIYDKTDWRPDFYVCFAQLPTKNKEWQESVIKATLNDTTTCFVPEQFLFFLPKRKNITFVKNVYEHYRHSPIPNNLFEISPQQNFLKSYSATVPLLQLSLFMGVKKLALVGQDGYLNERKNNHFCESYGFNPTDFKKTNKRLQDVHNVLSKYIKTKNIEVYNLSKVSILKQYSKIGLKEFILKE